MANGNEFQKSKSCTECVKCGKCSRFKNIHGITEGVMPTFAIEPITSKEECFGVAIDIGTTTIAAYLYKFPESKCVQSICVQNMQSIYGTDVISRISYSNKGGLCELYKTICQQIEELIESFKEEIDTIVLVANTIMLHFYAGLDPKGMESYPFKPNSLFGEWYKNIYIPPCISSYIGADITAGIIATNMLKGSTSLLVDIGTNCEIVLWHNKKLTCCSAAAGPAFEGFGISMGMPSISGAISKVYIKENKIYYTTIDNAEPKGICGTGLIDAIACIIELNLLDETGYLEEPFEIGNSKVYITAKDIRQIQLAKSAIKSGVDTLLEECDVTYEEIDKLFLSGSFGSLIDKVNSAKIGLISPSLVEKVITVGNSAGMGAAMILQSKECLKEVEKIADMAHVIELANSKIFMDKYIKNMMF